MYQRWYGEPHAAPELIGRVRVRAGRAVPRRARRRTRTSPRPGCYPTAVSLACAPLRRGASSSSRGHRRQRGVGRVGRGAGTEDDEPVLRSERERVAPTACSRIATPRRWSRRCRKSRGHAVEVLFTPHLVPTTRGILATCYARPAAAGPVDGAAARALPRVLRGRSVRRASSTSRRAPRRPTAPTSCTSPCAIDARTDTVLAIAAEDNLVKGASGQTIQAANLVLGLPETTGLPLARSDQP